MESKFNFKDRFIKVLESINNINQAENVVNDLFISSIFKSLLNYIDNNDDFLPRFKLLINKFNDYLIDDKKILVESEGYNNGNVVIQVGGNRHSLDDLSSGERHILTFLVTVLFKCNDRDLLLIDEPEMSLNTSWQSDLLGLLKELVPNTQIIVASHSPFIVSGRSDYLCELVVDR
ncbi:ATP-binding protein [Acinetobacter sp. R933-2]|uniref:AAA family ATPase n=1 Tax=Acinetobacter sp. R933-2 TaxID=2746728 RepID=UPI002575C98C|nr:AAA family ATPase [Acinetobacter sp. R933-2]MDM1248345.1 ATP-binding protein [Acinetobacter sp. R933-2]